MLEQNFKLTEEIYVMTKKIKSYLAFQRLVSIFYLFIIIAPIIISIIYLPPLLSGMFDQYKEALGIQGGVGGLDLNSLNANQIKSLLNK